MSDAAMPAHVLPGSVGMHRSVTSQRLMVEVHADPALALAAWRELAVAAPGTPYQTPEWAIPWLETAGAAGGIAPLIAVARAFDGSVTALLPLGIARRGPVNVASFLGGKDSNFNMGLFRPGETWSRADIEHLLRETARASRRRIDLFVLRNQPHGWEGHGNPFRLLPHRPSPSFAYKAALDRDPETFFNARLSRDGRKKLRHKMNRLAALGPVETVRATDASALREVIDTFIAQRTARCGAAGLPTHDLPILRRFLEHASAPDGVGPIEWYALRCGDRVLATLAGLRREGRFSAMLTSFSADPAVVRASPGDLLLAAVLRIHCEAGLSTFDLGVGEASYKGVYCPDAEPLFDSVVAVTGAGRLFARAEEARLRAKRAIKQSGWAWAAVRRLRKLRASRSSGVLHGVAVREG